MTGIVNSTGARSGVIGTTVGTPASKIVQVAYSQTASPATVSSTSTTIVSSGLSVTITNLVSGNPVLLSFSSGVGVSSSGESHREFYRGSTRLGAGGYGMVNINSSTFREWNMTWIDTGHGGGTHTYYVYHKTGGAGTSYIVWSTSYYNFSATEITA